ncbi:MAG TPA: proteasome accessory factor PafA2 family protein [Chthoniobacteraceae bacterium]|jgi:proteasome accessory factor A|nr:proteasome accessory factor PafA2 family protein [Chthoniobacteraceae bacterium]
MNPPLRLPKLLGEDLELGGSIIGGGAEFSGDTATRLVLDAVGGLPLADAEPRVLVTGDASPTPGLFDSRRNYLPNGGCIYQDMWHPEICTAEMRSARGHVAAHHAMFLLARDAAQRAGDRLIEGRSIELVARNSDSFNNSYGAHLNLLITRRAWRDVTTRLDAMSWFASVQVSMPIFTGQGKAGSQNGAPPCAYQLSQRADFFESVLGLQTTERRPLVNVRDEAHCEEHARLHVIFFDANLCHFAHWLKVGVLQILGAMLEARCWCTKQILADPVSAAVEWSHDPTLRTRVRTLHGRSVTALEHQRSVWEIAAKFVESGGCEEIVPEAAALVAAWGETLARLEAGDTAWLARRLDWVLKQQLLEGALAEQPELSWESPELRALDHRYGLLDGGLYFACEAAGLVERLVSPAEIERLAAQPPDDTRAWTRGRLLALAMEAPEVVESVNWDHIVFHFRRLTEGPRRWRAMFDDPLGCTAADSPIREAADLGEALRALAEADLLRPEKSRHEFQLYQPTEAP